VPIDGMTPGYLIHQYRFINTNLNDDIKIRINLRSDLSPSLSPVFLQIWNVATSSWETIDYDDSASAYEDIDLIKTISSNKDDYFDNNFEIVVRIYQHNLNL